MTSESKKHYLVTLSKNADSAEFALYRYLILKEFGSDIDNYRPFLRMTDDAAIMVKLRYGHIITLTLAPGMDYITKAC